MNDASRHKFNLHLPGLLKVLAEHLYSSRKVGVRELIQNAHDSCTRRRLEATDARYRPFIQVWADPAAKRLSIADNGSGLTEDEIANYLATIGRGYTGELREQLAFMSVEEAASLIGQFGLGFLSAFLLAGEVEVITRSMQPDAPTLRWKSAGDEHYTIAPADASLRDQPGTTVNLTLKPTAEFLLDDDTLRETVKQYADFLPIPIYFGPDRDESPVNLMRAPWEVENPADGMAEYARENLGDGGEPLAILPLAPMEIDLGHDTISVPMHGFLVVPPASVASVREYGDMTVYIRRMFICEREKDLLPAWAKFVRGIVDCPVLQPTASRESLHQDETFERVRTAIEEQLNAGLQKIAAEQPQLWRQIVRGHSDLIVGWAVRDPEFFDRVADIVTFRTSRGTLTLPEYLSHTGGTLYYVTREMGQLQDQVLAEGRDVPAIDASWFAVTPFLQRFSQRRAATGNEVRLVQLDGESESLFREVPAEPYAALVAHFKNQGVTARVAEFRPAELPAVMLYPHGAEIAREAGQAIEAGEVPSAIAGLFAEYLADMGPSHEAMKGTLFLNATSPLIRRIAADMAADSPADKHRAVLALLHQVARLFAGRMMDARDAIGAFGTTSDALGKLLD